MSKNKKMLLIYAFMLTIGQILIVAIISGVEALGNKIGIPLITEASGLVLTNMAVYLLLLIVVCLLFGNELRKEWQQEKKQIAAQIVKYGVVFLAIGIVVARTAEWLGISTTSNQEILIQMIDAVDLFSNYCFDRSALFLQFGEYFIGLYLRRFTKGYYIKQLKMDCQPTEFTALSRHRAVFSWAGKGGIPICGA